MAPESQSDMSSISHQPRLVPKLRFPEFRGEVGWHDAPIETLLEVRDERQPPTDNAPLYSLTIEDGVTPKSDRYNREFLVRDAANKKYKLVRPDDIVYNPSNLRWGAINFSRLKHEVVVSPIYEVLFVRDRSKLCFEFVARAVMRDEQIRRFITKAQGTLVERIAVKIEDFLETGLHTPSILPEQQKIADCLSSLDALIDAQSRKVEALKTYKKGLMQRMFPREGETVPRLRFKEFEGSGEWRVLPMGHLLTRMPEYGVGEAAVPYNANLPTYLRITDIDDDGNFLHESKASVDLDATENDYLCSGDIVLARTGASVGKSYLYKESDGRLVFAGFLIRIRPDTEKVNPVFLYNFFKTNLYWDWVKITSTRSGQPGLNGSEYASLAVSVPPEGKNGLTEQDRVASLLSNLDTEILAVSTALDGLKEHKKGLMQGLFPSTTN